MSIYIYITTWLVKDIEWHLTKTVRCFNLVAVKEIRYSYSNIRKQARQYLKKNWTAKPLHSLCLPVSSLCLPSFVYNSLACVTFYSIHNILNFHQSSGWTERNTFPEPWDFSRNNKAWAKNVRLTPFTLLKQPREEKK